MARIKKSLEELKPASRRARERFSKDPEAHERQKKWLRNNYLKKKSLHQIRKKLKVKEQRELCIKKLGSKCMSCGEQYNPYSSPSNLEFDHKFYLKDRVKKTETFRQVLNQINAGMDPNQQFTLLCHSCHNIITYIRKYPQKTKRLMDYLEKTDLLKTDD